MENEYNTQPIHAELTTADDSLHKVPAVRRCQFVVTQSHTQIRGMQWAVLIGLFPSHVRVYVDQ
jgi:hypothetical protein